MIQYDMIFMIFYKILIIVMDVEMFHKTVGCLEVKQRSLYIGVVDGFTLV